MYEDNSLRQQTLDNALLEMIACNMQPSSIVNDKGFNKCKFVRFQVPHPQSKKLPTKYEDVKATVMKCLENAAHVWLTTEIWTSRATQGYITVTCHFLDELWLMQTFVLETFNLTVSHTAENIAAELKRIANDWLTADKVVAMVTDNASDMVPAARLTGWKHIPCFAHTLNLIVQAALSADHVMADLKKNARAL